MTNHKVVRVLLLLILMPWQQPVSGVAAMNARASTTNSSHVLSALSYPSVRIGPYNWRYFRVEVPPAFAELFISLTRKWTGEHIGNYEAKLPMVCFRYGSPPLPDSLLESPEAAARAAGTSERLAGTGKCAWFHRNSSIALTNKQIMAGVWYVGVFSDSLPSRFQSKMITRGSIFTFGIHFTVFGCKLPNLRGRECDVSVAPLRFEITPSGLNSLPSRELNLDSILAEQGMIFANETPALRRSTRVRDEAWTSLASQHVGPGAWKYFSLEVADFASKLHVRAVCTSPHCGAASTGNGTGDANVFVKYGVLPDEGDSGVAISAAPVAVTAPRRGLWYIGVRNSNATEVVDFDLYWHVESCSYGGAGDICGAAINSMERVLVEDARESPFDSFYRPAKEEGLLSSPWFLSSEVTHIGNTTSGNWTYLFVEVPRGASGAVLSVQLRHVAQATIGVYARLEGLATRENWDAKVMNAQENGRRSSQGSFSNFTSRRMPVEVKQEESNRMSLDLVYPAEGIWCILVHYVKKVASVHETDLGNSPQERGISKPISSRFIQLWRNTSKFIVHLYHSFVEWLGVLWRKFRCALVSYTASIPREKTFPLSRSATIEEIDVSAPGHSLKNSEPSSRIQPSIELSSKRQVSEVQMHISLHGCVNECSGRGHCVTSYESSRLHLYSYCHCDASHGGIDCGVPLFVPTEESLHIWALIGSNAAAFLPSFWAMRHQAYSEWVSYIASGMASGLYHSCDAGGWCALSYDTLQFLDFWLSFVVVIVTCLYIASLKQETKAVAHVGAAIITAAITKENATSAWNVLLVVLMGLAGLLLGWVLECWRLHLIPSWLSAIGPVPRVIRWFYLTAGICILFTAGLSWVLETADTYWIWHSLWHVSIYTSAFLILCSTSKSTWIPEGDLDGYERTSPHANDREASPMLRQTVELDAFATDRHMS